MLYEKLFCVFCHICSRSTGGEIYWNKHAEDPWCKAAWSHAAKLCPSSCTQWGVLGVLCPPHGISTDTADSWHLPYGSSRQHQCCCWWTAAVCSLSCLVIYFVPSAERVCHLYEKFVSQEDDSIRFVCSTNTVCLFVTVTFISLVKVTSAQFICALHLLFHDSEVIWCIKKWWSIVGDFHCLSSVLLSQFTALHCWLGMWHVKCVAIIPEDSA